jgi:hypothetical protein
MLDDHHCEQKEVTKDDMERQAIELLVTASGKLILLDNTVRIGET